ncbi:MAG TPA: helix-turn-helix domain-containing protein [Xanthobacteraceae bacterium]|jgi:CRP-like cAMP-binding protein|nr:helix-turn-helix domain-containing protein [Xanthobacteraceae bacterium]
MLTQTIRTGSFRHAADRRSHAVPAPVSHPLLGSIEMMGAPMTFGRNAEIYGEGEPAEYLYKVVSGAVRTSKILADGRRQIGAFYVPGDIFGLEAAGEHTFSGEAIVETKVLVIKRSALVGRAARDNHLTRELWALTGRELARVQDHVLLLIKTAQERVAGFLLEMADRLPNGDAVELSMSRQDIADYLGLTIETVSRTLTGLESAATIALPSSRLVVLRNRAALRQLNA